MIDTSYKIKAGTENVLDAARDIVTDTANAIGEVISGYGENLSSNQTNKAMEKAGTIRKEAREKHKNELTRYEIWKSNAQQQLLHGNLNIDGVKESASKNGYDLTIKNRIDWGETNTANLTKFRNNRIHEEEKAYEIEKRSDFRSGIIEKVTGVDKSIEDIKVDAGIVEIINQLEILRADYQANIVDKLHNITIKIRNSDNKSWTGLAKDKSFQIMACYEAYADNFGYY